MLEAHPFAVPHAALHRVVFERKYRLNYYRVKIKHGNKRERHNHEPVNGQKPHDKPRRFPVYPSFHRGGEKKENYEYERDGRCFEHPVIFNGFAV